MSWDPNGRPPLRPGMVVTFKGRHFRVDRLESPERVHLDSGEDIQVTPWTEEIQPLKVRGLQLGRLRAFDQYPLKHQQEALRRKAVLDALLSEAAWGEGVLDKATKGLGASLSTLYRLVGWYLASGRQAQVLIPRVFRFGRCSNQLEERKAEALQTALLRYLDMKRPSIATIYDRMKTDCVEQKFDPPSLSTLKRKIRMVHPKELVSSRHGLKAAKDMYKGLSSKAPTGNRPLERVEMDHTPVNLLAVLPSGRRIRLYLTAILDLYSRMVIGLYLGPGGPSHYGLGLALYSMMTPKDPLLRRLGLSLEWPAFGKPKVIGTDSAVEFSGSYYYNICLSEDIQIKKRVRNDPASGGFIERLMGRAAMAMELFPGKTFENVLAKGEYDSESEASMEYAEVLRAFVLYFHKYHHSPHSGLRGRTPLSVFKKWMEENPEQAKVIQGSPATTDLQMSLLPSFYRSLSRKKINWESDTYEHWSIDPWVGTKNPLREDGKYPFHYDPNDVSRLYWREPGTGVWRCIPAKDTRMGEISMWERDGLYEEDKAEAKKSIDKEEAHRASREFYRLVDEMNTKSKKARAEEKKRKKSRKGKSPTSAWEAQKPIRQEAFPVAEGGRLILQTGPSLEELDAIEGDYL